MPLDDNYSAEDIGSDTRRELEQTAREFIYQNWELIKENLDRAGHDFWLTRQGAGAGFWDGDWPEAAGKRLTESSKTFGETTLYVGDDGKIHS